MPKKVSESEMDVLEQRALASAQRIFPCEKELLNNVPVADIVKHRQDEIQSEERPFLIRVVGQSGSGKSTQLMPALEEILQNTSYVKINVGAFAPFHPEYQKWQDQNPAMMREKTNGFALRALIMFYRYCVEHKTNILFDMTLLEPEIEEYLMSLAKKSGYQIQLHVLCVPKKVSDRFIRQRYLTAGRYVSSKSSNYFFDVLARSLKSLINQPFFDRTDSVFLWSHYHEHPLKKTSFFNPYVMTILMENRRNLRIKKASSLLKAKKTWLRLCQRKS